MACIPNLPVALSSPLLPIREAITDALSRCLVGLNTNDPVLFNSAFTQDATFELNGTVSQALPTIRTDCYDKVSQLDTTHFVSNMHVDRAESGDNTTKMTATSIGRHYRDGKGLKQGQTRLLTGNFYWMDLKPHIAALSPKPQVAQNGDRES
ncbi:uncharacterized protein ATNIH1004_008526 [Aspergillus tanneri]|uniref:SnoaL-like domain-containing protein n=1 Tax=Aspergillus tanneri TaxID=1220188 RepID=A0A5M9MB86_9EURO|nr:uncharacterized protein ATNIH1004_008526 [Aspergillus tanneri]KAA8644325.1 hypothetical protein ATNIH1004_008526 [Aspergillus tanneri]